MALTHRSCRLTVRDARAAGQNLLAKDRPATCMLNPAVLLGKIERHSNAKTFLCLPGVTIYPGGEKQRKRCIKQGHLTIMRKRSFFFVLRSPSACIAFSPRLMEHCLCTTSLRDGDIAALFSYLILFGFLCPILSFKARQFPTFKLTATQAPFHFLHYNPVTLT